MTKSRSKIIMIVLFSMGIIFVARILTSSESFGRRPHAEDKSSAAYEYINNRVSSED